jgi:hypothetical protein
MEIVLFKTNITLSLTGRTIYYESHCFNYYYYYECLVFVQRHSRQIVFG